MKRLPLKPLILLPLSLLAACASVTDKLPDFSTMVTPYVIDVRQGNFVSQDMAAQLKLGMTKDQVRFVLGSPLLTDAFHADRWDYVYRFKPGKKDVQQRRLAVFFVDGKLAKVDGDVVAAGSGSGSGADPADSPNRVIEITAPVAPAEKPADKPAPVAAEAAPAAAPAQK